MNTNHSDAFGGYCELPHCNLTVTSLCFSFNISLVFLKSSRISTVRCGRNIDGVFFQLGEDSDSLQEWHFAACIHPEKLLHCFK